MFTTERQQAIDGVSSEQWPHLSGELRVTSQQQHVSITAPLHTLCNSWSATGTTVSCWVLEQDAGLDTETYFSFGLFICVRS